jgi:hypothetical protein
MADLCYYIRGKRQASSVFVSPNETIVNLKRRIHDDGGPFDGCKAPDIILTKVRYLVISLCLWTLT